MAKLWRKATDSSKALRCRARSDRLPRSELINYLVNKAHRLLSVDFPTPDCHQGAGSAETMFQGWSKELAPHRPENAVSSGPSHNSRRRDDRFKLSISTPSVYIINYDDLDVW